MSSQSTARRPNGTSARSSSSTRNRKLGEASSRPAVQRAIDQLAGVGGTVIGAVLNKVDLKRNSYYYSQYYGEYYRSYYAPSGSPSRLSAITPLSSDGA